mmetsp:Transcript_9059/g.16337  ORF Transcript_9059/g.16337 Transcript_9059/m.16337 type:complete len:209 (-) Transcript_9059:161-787(-)
MASLTSIQQKPLPKCCSSPRRGGRQLYTAAKAASVVTKRRSPVTARADYVARPEGPVKMATGIVSATDRRALLLGAGLAVLVPGRSQAEEGGLPKGYAKLAPKLVDSLLDSIQLEEEGANEFEVRRKADEAKPLVREFVAKWKEDSRLSGERSQKEIKEGLRLLGEFYMKNGQRVALPRAVVDEVRGHLLAAKAALPEAEEKKGFLGF